MSDEHLTCGEHRHDLSCREICDFMMAFLDGDLPAGERAVFEEHLALCPPCVQYLDSYKKTIALSKQALDAKAAQDPCGGSAPQPPIPEGLVKAILAARKQQK
ncbi:MAG: zf-HC2 domain-containing protein [Pirellulales bacterium]